jgi:UDP-N-acetylmuramate-alanine ligase
VAAEGFAFDLSGDGPVRVRLQVPGRHNVLNAAAAAAAGLQAGLPIDAIAESLGRFTGVGRRFDVLGEAAGVIVVDDYAHHPTEIRTTIAAARSRYPDRSLWVVWQPHTYSRVALLCRAFAGSFSGADHVIVTDVYAAREDVREYLATSRMPTLVVVGREDGISPPDEMRSIAEASPGAEFHVIEGAGHMAPLESPAEFNRMLTAFVERV